LLKDGQLQPCPQEGLKKTIFTKEKTMKKITITTMIAVMLTFGAVMPSLGGSVRGPQYLGGEVVAAYGTKIYTATFRANEYASVGVSGDGDTDLDLYVYDDQGRLISKDDGPSDECRTRMIVYRTSRFTIKVVNRGSLYNEFDIWTD
jgi:hypothetical protein